MIEDIFKRLLYFFISTVTFPEWFLLYTGVLVLTIFIWIKVRQPANFPPGPRGFPFIGYLPFLSKEPYVDLSNLHKKYGDVFSFRIPGYNVVVCNTYETVREVFLRQGDSISVPPGFTVVKWLSRYAGFFSPQDWIWREHRRFSLRTLKDFGFGRMQNEDDIHRGINMVLSAVQDNVNKPFDLTLTLSKAASNVVNKLIFSKSFEAEDGEFKTLRDSGMAVMGNKALPGMEAFRPFVLYGKYIPFRFIPGFWHMDRIVDNVYEMLDNIIAEHEKAFDPDNLQDFIDMYLNKIKNAEEGTSDKIAYEKKNLASVCLGLAMGGMDTSSNTTSWGIKLLCLHKDVQEKMQKEIDEVIGREKLPSYADSPYTPYVNATINEIQRISTLLPVTFYLRNHEDIKVSKYKIPKNTLLLANLYSVHRDPKHWVKPDEFDPDQNCFGPDGKLKRDGLIPFFIGKRSCLGEILARMQIYLTITALFQRYSFRLADGESKELDCLGGMTRFLRPFKVIATPRF